MNSFNNSRRLLDSCERDCPDRKGGCHATCERYAAAKKKYEKEKAESGDNYDLVAYAAESRARKIDQMVEKKRQFAGHSWGGGRRP